MNLRYVKIGDAVRKRRLELGKSQEEMCYEICSVSTLSRIENGESIPKKVTFDKLMERLGMNVYENIKLVSDEYYEIEELREKIINECADGNYDKVNELLQKFKTYEKSKDNEYRQFLLRYDAMYGQYSNEEKLDKLKEAISLTCKDFKETDIGNYVLNIDEIKTIISLANTYSKLENLEKSIFIYDKLMEYCDKHFMSLVDISQTVILIAYNFSRLLALNDEYKRAVTIADIGIEQAIKFQRYKFYGKTLCNKAYSLCKMGNMEEGKETYKKSAAFFYSIGEIKNMNIIINAAKNRFDIEI